MVAPPPGTEAVFTVRSVSEPMAINSSPAKRGETFRRAVSPAA